MATTEKQATAKEWSMITLMAIGAVGKVVRISLGSAVVSLFLTLVVAALAIYGIINISAARIILVLAGLVSIAGIVTSDYVGDKSRKHVAVVLLISLLVIGGGLFWLDNWATRKRTEMDALTAPSKPISPSATVAQPTPTSKSEPTPEQRATQSSKPKSSNSSGANNSGSVGGNITTGPCSNVQMGGTGNSASTNCGPQLRFPESNIDTLARLLDGRSGTVSIDVKNADSLTIRDANNLLTAFAKAHWTTSGVNQTTHGTDIGADGLPIPDPLGIHLRARSERLALAEFVQKSIKQSIGIESHVETDENVTSVDVAIVVGAFE